MKHLLIVNLLLISISIYGQFRPKNPFIPTIPLGLNPKWYQTQFDSSAINSNFDGYNQFKGRFQELAQIKGNNVYLIESRQGDLGIMGYYLEKRSLLTGNLLWRRYFGYSATTYIDMPRHMFINEKGNLEIFSQMFPDPLTNNPGIGSRKMVFMFREIDFTNGETIEESIGDPNNDDSFRSHFTFLNKLTISSIYRIGRNKYRFFELDAKANQTAKYKVSVVSSISKKSTTQTDSIDLISFQSIIPPILIVDKKYLLIERIIATNQLIFRHVDERLNLIRQDTSPVIGPLIIYPEVIGIDTVNKVLLFKNLRDNNPSTSATDIIWFGFDGKILHKWNMDHDYKDVFDVIEWSPDRVKLLVTKLPNNFPDSEPMSADIVEYSMADSVKTLQSYIYGDTLRFVNDFFLLPIPETDDYFLQWFEGAFYYTEFKNLDRDFNASALSILRIRKSDLLSRLDEIIRPQTHMTLYPNPATDIVTVSLPSSVSGSLQIYNAVGHCLQSYVLNHQDNMIIDLGDVAAGMYFFRIDDGKGNMVYNSKLIKI